MGEAPEATNDFRVAANDLAQDLGFPDEHTYLGALSRDPRMVRRRLLALARRRGVNLSRSKKIIVVYPMAGVRS